MLIAYDTENKIAEDTVFPNSVTNMLIANTAKAKNIPQISKIFGNGLYLFSAASNSPPI
jgi:hypothetical protein